MFTPLLNTLMGWMFILAALFALIKHRPDMATGWLILAKLCWIHADIQDIDRNKR